MNSNFPIHEINSFSAMPSFFELLIVLLVVVFALILIAKKLSGVIALLVGLGLMGLLGAGVLLSIFYQRMGTVEVIETYSFDLQHGETPMTMAMPSPTVDVPHKNETSQVTQISAWDDSISATANIYPGIAECGVPLASRIADALIAKEGNSKTRYTVKLTSVDLSETNLTKLSVYFLNTVKAKLPANSVTNTYIAKNATPPTVPATADAAPVVPESPVKIVKVRLSKILDDDPSTKKWSNDLQGQVVCEWSVDDDESTTDAVEFIDKPWVSNPNNFFSTPNGKNQMIAYSSRLASSQHEAHRSAMEAFRRQFRETQNRSFPSNFYAEKAVADRFVQKLTMPYGSVWREAVLVKTDTGPVQFSAGSQAHSDDSVIADYRQANVSVGRVRTSPEFLLALLAGLIIAVGWVSNVLTQGYYRKPIKTATLSFVSIGVIVLVLLVLATVYA